MSRKDEDASLEEAYIARFRGRSIACRRALIEIDPEAGTAVANPKTYAAFLARYTMEAHTELDARDARFYALFFERSHVTKETQSWYLVLAALGDEAPLREFYVREGMTSPALERYKTLTNGEVKTIVEGNMRRLRRKGDYDERRVVETIQACTTGEHRGFLRALLDQCVKDAQLTASVLVATALGRNLTDEEARTLGLNLIRRCLHEPTTLQYVRRMTSLQLISTYIDAIIDDSEGRADEVFAQARGLKYELTFAQLEKLYEMIKARQERNFDSLPPNVWLPVIEEMARRSEAWREKLADAYDIAARQSLRKLKTAQASYLADKQGLPLRPIELYTQYHHLKGPRYEKSLHQTKTYARELLLKRLEEWLGKPDPD